MTAAFPSDRDGRDRFVLDRRGPRDTHDPLAVPHWLVEDEPAPGGGTVRVATIFLTGRECPWRCVMCDLWQHTIPSDTPRGAIPHQIAGAVTEMARNESARPVHIKLYNAGSFLDERAVPPEDYAAIAETIAGFSHVIVESHPALIARRIDRLARELSPATLEVAMGLETAHPEALDQLNKRMTLDDFRGAADILAARGIALRAFLLIHPPFVADADQDEWLARSVDAAFDAGAAVVSLIPMRRGNGAVDALETQGLFRAPRRRDVERAFDTALARSRGRVLADLWDLDRFADCASCAAARRDRLARMNLTQRIEAPVSCAACGDTA